MVKYNLPSITDILDSKPEKRHWKAICKRAVHSHWTERIREEASVKSSLQPLNLDYCDTKTPHQLWLSTPPQAKAILKANTKLRMTVGTYLTMHNAQKYFNMDPICRLCYKEDETISHVLLYCPALHKPRSRHGYEAASLEAEAGFYQSLEAEAEAEATASRDLEAEAEATASQSFRSRSRSQSLYNAYT